MFDNKTFYSVDEVRSNMQLALQDNLSVEHSISELEFEMDANSNLQVILQNGTYTATQQGIVSICKEVGVPYGYYLKISDDLRLRNLRTRAKTFRRDRKLRLNEDEKIFRGCVPRSHAEFPNDKWLDYLPVDVKLIPVDNYNPYDLIREKSISWRVLFDEIEASSDPDSSKVFYGLTVRTSELGDFWYNFPCLWRQICNNGMVLTDSVKSEHYRLSYGHLDDTLVKGLLDSLIRSWTDRYTNFDTLVDEMVQNKLSFEQIVQVIESLEKFKITKKFINESIEALPVDSTLSQWDLINYVTSSCQKLTTDARIMTEHAISSIMGVAKIFQN